MQPHPTHNDWHHWQRGTVSSPLPTLPPVQSTSPSSLQPRYNPTNHLYQPYARLTPRPKVTRPRLTTTLWEDESTMCYQVDSRGICVARRQDNDMINGTKLLNVAGMSRGKRDGILKNERGRIVVKVGAMHLKGVWIPFVRAKALANQFKIFDILHPIFSDDPGSFLYPSSSHFHQMNRLNSSSRMQNENHRLYYNGQPDSSTGSVQGEILTMTGRRDYEPYYYSESPSLSSSAQSQTPTDKSFW